MQSWTFGLTPSGLPIEQEQVIRGGTADGGKRTSGPGPVVQLLDQVQQFPLQMPCGRGIAGDPHAAEFLPDQPDFPAERIGRGIRQPPVPSPAPRPPLVGPAGLTPKPGATASRFTPSHIHSTIPAPPENETASKLDHP